MTDLANRAPAPPGPNDPETFASGFQEVAALPVGDLSGAGDRSYSAPRRVLRRPWVVQLIAFGILLAIWQYLTVAGGRVPSIENVASFMWTEITGGSHGGMLLGEFWGVLGLSLQRYAIGLAIGIPAGAVLGLLIGASRWVRGLLNDTTLVLLALPAVVWAFLASLWFGLTSTAPIVAVVLTAIPFVAINLSSGVRGIDPALVEMSKSYRVSRRNQLAGPAAGRDPAQLPHRRAAGVHHRVEQPADRGVVRRHRRSGLAGPLLVRRAALRGLRGLGVPIRDPDHPARPARIEAPGAPGVPVEPEADAQLRRGLGYVSAPTGARR